MKKLFATVLSASLVMILGMGLIGCTPSTPPAKKTDEKKVTEEKKTEDKKTTEEKKTTETKTEEKKKDTK